jgi:hypothetical protein
MPILEFEKEGSPPDKIDLLKQMQALDEDVVAEYLSGMKVHVDLLNTWRDILACVHSPGICQDLIEELDEEKLRRLAQIVDTLGKKDLLKHIQTLLNQSYNYDPPHGSDEKAMIFIEILKKINVQRREEIALSYASGARELRLFSELILGLNRGLISEEFFLKLNDAEMDGLIALAKELT